jgi:hypothetical protein
VDHGHDGRIFSDVYVAVGADLQNRGQCGHMNKRAS